MTNKSQDAGDRFLAVILMVGGVLGIGISIYMAAQFITVHWIYGVLVAGFLVLFAWSTLAGFRLWRRERRGWKWATIVFGLQIPVFTFPGIDYEFYTGLAAKIMGGHVDKTFAFELGSSANFYLSTEVTNVVYGINVFALIAFIYLFTRRANYPAAAVAAPAVVASAE